MLKFRKNRKIILFLFIIVGILILINNCSKSDFPVGDNQNKGSQINILKNEFFQGIWMDNFEPVFIVRGDSIYYIDDLLDPVFYEISYDSITIYYDGYIKGFKFEYLTTDSLCMIIDSTEKWNLKKK